MVSRVFRTLSQLAYVYHFVTTLSYLYLFWSHKGVEIVYVMYIYTPVCLDCLSFSLPLLLHYRCAKVEDAQNGEGAVQQAERVGDEDPLLAQPEDADKDAGSAGRGPEDEDGSGQVAEEGAVRKERLQR